MQLDYLCYIHAWLISMYAQCSSRLQPCSQLIVYVIMMHTWLAQTDPTDLRHSSVHLTSTIYRYGIAGTALCNSSKLYIIWWGRLFHSSSMIRSDSMVFFICTTSYFTYLHYLIHIYKYILEWLRSKRARTSTLRVGMEIAFMSGIGYYQQRMISIKGNNTFRSSTTHKPRQWQCIKFVMSVIKLTLKRLYRFKFQIVMNTDLLRYIGRQVLAIWT